MTTYCFNCQKVRRFERRGKIALELGEIRAYARAGADVFDAELECGHRKRVVVRIGEGWT